MSKFGKNLKKIRKVKKLSQTGFADLFDMSRASVGAYEEERAEPRIDTIVTVAKYFSIPLEELLTKDLTVNDIYNFDIFKEDIFSNDKKRKAYAGSNAVVPYISAEEHSEYIRNMQDPEYTDRLPFMSIPFPQAGIGIAIEHNSGDMMFNERGIYQGDIIFCSRLGENFTEQISNGQIYLIVAEQDVFLRRVLVRRHLLALFPDNPNYEAIYLPVEKVRQLWLPKVKMSRHINQVQNTSMLFDEFEQRMRMIEKKLTDTGK